MTTQTRHKLDPRSLPCIFLGYDPQRRGYICLHLPSGRRYSSRHVIFHESIFPYTPDVTQAIQQPNFLPVRTPPRSPLQTSTPTQSSTSTSSRNSSVIPNSPTTHEVPPTFTNAVVYNLLYVTSSTVAAGSGGGGGGGGGFRSRTWYPVHTSLPLLKHLELVLVLSFSVMAIASNIIDYPSLRFTFRLDNSEHATMFFHLVIYSSFALAFDIAFVKEPVDSHPTHHVVGVLASSVFFQELFLLHFHSADHKGIEGHYHWLLQLIVSISLVSTVISTSVPSSFSAAVIRSASVLFQGLWFFDMGFALWGHAGGRGGSGGCVMVEGSMPVVCESPAALTRAKAVANLEFSWILAGIWVFVGLITCLNASSRRVSKDYKRMISDDRSVKLGVYVPNDI